MIFRSPLKLCLGLLFNADKRKTMLKTMSNRLQWNIFWHKQVWPLKGKHWQNKELHSHQHSEHNSGASDHSEMNQQVFQVATKNIKLTYSFLQQKCESSQYKRAYIDHLGSTDEQTAGSFIYWLNWLRLSVDFTCMWSKIIWKKQSILTSCLRMSF